MQRRWIFGDPIIAKAILDWLPQRAATNCIQGERYLRKRRCRAGQLPGRDEGGGQLQSRLVQISAWVRRRRALWWVVIVRPRTNSLQRRPPP
jgi:hypothetical protein